jgi:dihydrofolate reductase
MQYDKCPVRTRFVAISGCDEASGKNGESMGRLRVNAYSVSLDGYGAGPDQSLGQPLGRGGEALHQWLVPTRTFRAMQGEPGGTGGIDDAFAARSMEGLGAWILGRNMFGPVRGPWPDESWRGWWGEEPPYHCPVFVLTHHPRPPLEMEGGTVFHFVTGGIGEALERAREAAGGRDVRVGGGAATIRQYLEARLIDELHLAVAPLLLGAGEPLFAGLDLPALGYHVAEHRASDQALHVVLARR